MPTHVDSVCGGGRQIECACRKVEGLYHRFHKTAIYLGSDSNSSQCWIIARFEDDLSNIHILFQRNDFVPSFYLYSIVWLFIIYVKSVRCERGGLRGRETHCGQSGGNRISQCFADVICVCSLVSPSQRPFGAIFDKC